jgi:hypothetical protein
MTRDRTEQPASRGAPLERGRRSAPADGEAPQAQQRKNLNWRDSTHLTDQTDVKE